MKNEVTLVEKKNSKVYTHSYVPRIERQGSNKVKVFVLKITNVL